MDSHRVLLVLRDKINEDIAQKKDNVAYGNVADWASFQNVCGQIRGLEFALGHINSLLQNLDEDE